MSEQKRRAAAIAWAIEKYVDARIAMTLDDLRVELKPMYALSRPERPNAEVCYRELVEAIESLEGADASLT